MPASVDGAFRRLSSAWICSRNTRISALVGNGNEPVGCGFTSAGVAGCSGVWGTAGATRVLMGLGGPPLSPFTEHILPSTPTQTPGVESVYVWGGKVQVDSEQLLIIKTRASLIPRIVDTVKVHHPYEEPEVVAIPVTGGSPSYLAWVTKSTAS